MTRKTKEKNTDIDKATKQEKVLAHRADKSTVVDALPQPGGAEIGRVRKRKKKQTAPYMMAY